MALPMALDIKKSVLSLSQLISADIVAKALGIAVLMFYTRYLTKDHLSLLPIYGMLGGMSTLFFSFGIFPTFVRSLPSLFENDMTLARAMILTGSSIVMTGAALFSFAIYCFAEQVSLLVLHDHSYSYLLQIMSLGFFAVGLRTVTDYIMWSASRFDKISFLKIFQSVTNAILTVGLFLLIGLKGFVLGMVIRDIMGVCLSVFFLKDILFCKTVRFYSVKKLLKQSFPFYLETYLMYFRSQGDNWIVSTFLGPAPMAIYYIAKRLYDMLFMIFVSADKVITTDLSSKCDNRKNVEERVSQIVRAISQTVFPSVFFIIGLTPAFIYVIAGETYGESVIPSIILLLTIVVRFVICPIGRAIFVLKPPATRFKLTLVESLCLITALLSFTPILGESGVALSRFLASAVAVVYAYFILKTVINIHVPVRQIFVSLSISMLMAAFLLTCQTLNFSLYILPFYICGALLIFFFFTNWFNSKVFYETLNSILPFKVGDPVELCLRGGHKVEETK